MEITEDGKVVVRATMEEEDYNAWKEGRAVFNNGLRSPKGSYWPNQPEYSENKGYDYKSDFQRLGVQIVEDFITDVGLPLVKRGITEYAIPFVASLVRKETKASRITTPTHERQIVANKPDNVIDFPYQNKKERWG